MRHAGGAATHGATREPFIVAHRAGNDPLRLRAAAALGVSLAEADVHLYRGSLEVRHLKTAGPLPVLWDRWALAPAGEPRMQLESLLAAAHGGPELMLDLKGHTAELPARVLAAIAAAGLNRRLSVCAQDWRLLEPLRGAPDVRVVHSVGGARMLRRLRRSFRDERLEGISIHRRLLDGPTVRDLKARAELVMSWPVERPDVARTLVGFGVDGLISQAFEVVSAGLSPRSADLRAAA